MSTHELMNGHENGGLIEKHTFSSRYYFNRITSHRSFQMYSLRDIYIVEKMLFYSMNYTHTLVSPMNGKDDKLKEDSRSAPFYDWSKL